MARSCQQLPVAAGVDDKKGDTAGKGQLSGGVLLLMGRV